MASDVAYYLNKESYPLSKRLGAANPSSESIRGRDINWRSGINTYDHDTGLTPIMVAAIQGRRDLIVALVERGADVHLKDEKKSRTALHFAAKGGHLDSLQELLRRGCLLEARDNGGKTPLMLCCKGGFVDCAVALMRVGATPNLLDQQERSALHYAARLGHAPCVRALLAQTAAVEFRDIDGFTPLHLASQFGRRECAVALCEQGAAKVDRRTATEKQTALMLAAREGHKSLLSYLISQGAQASIVDAHGWTALHYAASWGRRDSAHILIVDGKADVNARDRGRETAESQKQTQLEQAEAVQTGSGASGPAHRFGVRSRDKVFLGSGAPPLVVAAKSGHVAVLELLLRYGADIHLPELSSGENALCAAAALGAVESVDCLLQSGTNVNWQNPFTATTALMLSAKNAQRSVSTSLLNSLADINILDRDARTAAIHAQRSGDRALRALLEAILQCSPQAKVNLLPWLESECPRLAFETIVFQQQSNGISLNGFQRSVEDEPYNDRNPVGGLSIGSTVSAAIAPSRTKTSHFEYDSIFESANCSGVSAFLRNLLLGDRGLFFGLFSLDGDCDAFLIYALTMVASTCKETLRRAEAEQSIWFASTSAHRRRIAARNIAEISTLLSQCEEMLVRCLNSARFDDERAVADVLVLGAHSTAELSHWDDSLMISAFSTGPLALCLQCDLKSVLATERIQEMTCRTLQSCARGSGCVVDGYGHRTSFLRWRYCPATSVLIEGIGNALIISIIAVYAYVSPTNRFRSTPSGLTNAPLSTIEILLAFCTISMVTYSVGLMEEQRWAVSPSIVFHFKDLERKRIRQCFNVFVEDPLRFCDLIGQLLCVTWLIFRFTAFFSAGYSGQERQSLIIAASACLVSAAVPLGTTLLRPVLIASEDMRIQFFGLIIALESMKLLMMLFVLVLTGFGIALYAVHRGDNASFSSIRQTAQSLFAAVVYRDDWYLSATSSSAASAASTVSLLFFAVCAMGVQCAVAGYFSASMATRRRDAHQRASKWICERTREYSLSLERSALCVLPAPFSLVGLAVYVAHGHSFFSGRVSRSQRAALSVAGSAADVTLALITLPLCSSMEYSISVLESRNGLLIKFIRLLLLPAGATYAACCLIYKLFEDRAIRARVKSRFSDGRLRLLFGREREHWERESLARFEDERLCKELERFSLTTQHAVSIMDETQRRRARIVEKARRARRRARERKRKVEGRSKEDLVHKYGRHDEEKDEDYDLSDSDGDYEPGSDVEDDKRDDHDHSSDDDMGEDRGALWQRVFKSMAPYFRRNADSLGEKVRFAPTQRFLELNFVDVHAAQSGIPLMHSETERQRVRRIRDGTQDPVSLMEREKFRVFTAQDLHSLDSNVARDVIKDPPSLLWAADDEVNPYQAGIESQSQWQQLSLEAEPFHQVQSGLNPFDEDSDVELPPATDIQAPNPSQESSVQIQPKDVDPKESRRRDWRREWEQRLALENVKLGENESSLEKGGDGSAVRSASLYFTPQRFAPIFTARERKYIFEVVLPEIFLDDVSRAIERENERLCDLEARLRRQELHQLEQLKLLQTLYSTLVRDQSHAY